LRLAAAAACLTTVQAQFASEKDIPTQ
jgi:hypothetical protein